MQARIKVMLYARAFLAVVLFAAAFPAVASKSPSPFDRHAAAIGGWSEVMKTESVRATAEIRSPRGTLRLELLWGKGGRLFFRQSREGASSSMWVLPGRSSGEDGRPLDDSTRAFVRAHDFFGIVLDPRSFFRPAGEPSPGSFEGKSTEVVPVRDPEDRLATLHFSAQDGTLAGFEMTDPRRPKVKVAVAVTDYRPAGSIKLPRTVTARDDAGEWVMKFDDVAVGAVPAEAFTPPAASPRTDEEALLALHREVLDGHLAGDTRWLQSEPEDYVIANRGQITTPSLEARRKRFASYLAASRFTTYRDLAPPIVKVANDGSLGWVICQVEAAGSQKADEKEVPISFVSAWIELYEKREGNWRRVGNVSNFK